MSSLVLSARHARAWARKSNGGVVVNRVAIFQFYVLGTLAKNSEGSDTLRYANALRAWLEEGVFDKRQRVRLSSIRRQLLQFESQGMVTGRDVSFGKMKMRCYTLTAAGREELRRRCVEMEQLVGRIQRLLDTGIPAPKREPYDRDARRN